MTRAELEAYAEAHPESERDLATLTGRLALLREHARRILPRKGCKPACAVLDVVIERFQWNPGGRHLVNRACGYVEMSYAEIARWLPLAVDGAYVKKALPLIDVAFRWIRIERGRGGVPGIARATRWHIIEPSGTEIAEMLKEREAARELIRAARRKERQRYYRARKARRAEEARMLAEILS